MKNKKYAKIQQHFHNQTTVKSHDAWAKTTKLIKTTTTFPLRGNRGQSLRRVFYTVLKQSLQEIFLLICWKLLLILMRMFI